MAEGDTVAATARRLHQALARQVLTRSELRVSRFATVDLSGQEVLEVGSRGKHLLLRTSAGLTLHSHLRMEGRWELHRPGSRWAAPAREVRAVLETEPWVAVGYRLGALEVLPTREEHRVVGHLGPDPLGPDWDPDEAVRRLRARPERPIGEALVDQRAIAGLGNVYRCEVCFLAGLDPATPVGRVPDLPKVVGLAKRLLQANREGGRQVTTGDPRPGRDRWVYGRAGKPCRRCGTPVRRRADLAADAPRRARVTYWCPSCQPDLRTS
ncbi:MAG TPA: DNA-formamidopyrimidine glycosylase family protein [Actinomycetota bacterium]|nr:DNA-formamidopyrimidine glycosylase family protein [Actinomycetota bacterium]